MVTTKQYGLLSRLTNSSSSVSFVYAYNSANQRTRATLADGSYWVYTYDSLGQVISGKRYWSDGTPVAGQQFITADGGGSNGSRLRLWKLELQGFADETGLALSICHFPPGTSKWNKIEHRLFSFISSNWRGEPLRDYQTIVKLIAKTTTAKGLKVTCRLDRRKYPTGRKVSDEEMEQVNLKRNTFHGDWNYVIKANS